MNENLKKLLARTNFNQDIEVLLNFIAKTYPLIGKIDNYLPIYEGYEDPNIILTSKKGKFVLKIFLKDREPKAIKHYAEVLLKLNDINVSTTKIVKGNQGYISTFPSQKPTQFFITEFFEGHDFKYQTPTLSQMKKITHYLAMINTLNLKVNSTYDSWGIKNILKEYRKYSELLSASQKQKISSIVSRFSQINLSKLPQAFIHGDMQRKHVLLNSKNQYCILDFGCMAYDARIIDLSIYLAWFCLQGDTWSSKEKIIKSVTDEYQKIHQLTNEEKRSLLDLIKSSWAAYYLATIRLMAEGDKSEETVEWHQKSLKLLDLSKDWETLIIN